MGIELRRFDAAGTTTIADHTGKPLVVNLFASWCAPCVREMPAFEATHRALGARVRFLGVAVRDSQRSARALVDETDVSYDLALDPKGALLAEFHAVGMPVTVLVHPDGTIATVHSGELDAGRLRALLATQLGVR